MGVVLKPDLPEEKFPPAPRQHFDATALQNLIIKTFLERGYGEGTVRLHQRLQARFKDMIHPGVDTTRNADDPDNYQKDPATGKPLLIETAEYDDQCQFTANGVLFQIPCAATFEFELDPVSNQPISIGRGQPRLFPGQQQKMAHSGWKPRKLCPTRKMVEAYLRRIPTSRLIARLETPSPAGGGHRLQSRFNQRSSVTDRFSIRCFSIQ